MRNAQIQHPLRGPLAECTQVPTQKPGLFEAVGVEVVLGPPSRHVPKRGRFHVRDQAARIQPVDLARVMITSTVSGNSEGVVFQFLEVTFLHGVIWISMGTKIHA